MYPHKLRSGFHLDRFFASTCQTSCPLPWVPSLRALAWRLDPVAVGHEVSYVQAKIELSQYIDIITYSRFYIGCDRCQDWFHGSCVGITKSEADKLDTYICPNCQKSRDSMVTTKLITDRGRAELKRLINQLQVQYHTLTLIPPPPSHPPSPSIVTTKLITDIGRAELKRLINQLQVTDTPHNHSACNVHMLCI